MLDRAVLLPASPDPLVANAVALEGVMGTLTLICLGVILFTCGLILGGMCGRASE